MRISSTDIKKTLRSIWPELFNIWLQDKTFYLPSKERLDEFLFLERKKLAERKWIGQVSDCDDFAKWAMGDASWVRADLVYANKVPKDDWYPWPFLYASTNMIHGKERLHALNLCICDDDIVYLIDPSADCEIWIANYEKDNVFYVFG